MKKNKKTNKTTLVVRDAMKSVAKDVRSPKMVRDGIVKPKKEKKQELPHYTPAPKKQLLDFIIIDNKIKLKGKNEVLNTPIFTQEQKYATILEDYENMFSPPTRIPTQLINGDVRLLLDIKPAKLKKLINLIQKQKKISFVAKFKNKTTVTAFGFLASIEDNYKEGLSLTYSPDYFKVDKL